MVFIDYFSTCMYTKLRLKPAIVSFWLLRPLSTSNLGSCLNLGESKGPSKCWSRDFKSVGMFSMRHHRAIFDAQEN